MKKFTLTLFITLAAGLLQAQTVTLDWVKKIGGASFDEAYAMAFDPSGNICIAGSFSGVVDFDPSPTKTFNLNSSSGSPDIFVCKLDSKGNFMWAKAMGGDYEEVALTISIDANGAIYTAGFFEDIVDFDPGSKVYNITSAGLDDIFISKLDASGNFVWAKQIGSGGLEYANSMSIKNASIYITGTFQSIVDFDPSPDTFNLTSAGEFDIYILKLDTMGNFAWAGGMGGQFTEGGNSISIDAFENVYTTGFYQDDADFDPSANTYILKSQGASEIFVSKLDSAGKFVWAKRMGAPSDDQGLSIIADDSGNTYSTGFFTGVVDFNPGPPKFNLTAAGAVDVFILKLDAKGNFAWAKRIGGTSTDVGNCVTLDKKGNVYSTGYFDGTADFDPGSAIYELTSAQSLDLYISKLDTTGKFIWAYRLGGKQSEYSQSINIDNYGDVYTTGYFEDTANFAIDTMKTVNLIAAGNDDIFIHKIKQCASTSSNITITACNSFLFRNQNIHTNGIYIDTLINARGCDSFVTLNLTVIIIDSTITQTGNILTSNAATASYQWLDCNNNYTPINGETKQSFKPTINGNYAVAITSNSCTDTSACYQILNAGIIEQNQNYIQIFPNPTQGKFTIAFDKQIQNANIKIYNITGQVILQKANISGNSFMYDIGEYGAGIYLVELVENGRRMVGRVVVQY